MKNFFNQFNSVIAPVPKKNLFDLSHNFKFTCEMGQLIPVFVQDVIPNDTFKISAQSLIKFAPLVAPMLSEVDVYFHFFFVPNRIIWSDWETFITGAKDGVIVDDPGDIPIYPTYIFEGDNLSNALGTDRNKKLSGVLLNRSLADYLGFQTYPVNYFNSDNHLANDAVYELDALPFCAYNKIYNDYYRDENLIEEGALNDSALTGSNPASIVSEDSFRIHYRAWKKDYFTSALPWAQAGDDVLIPGIPTGSLTRNNNVNGFSFTNNTGSVIPPGSDLVNGSSLPSSPGFQSSPVRLKVNGAVSSQTLFGVNPTSLNVVKNGDGTIRELRRAFAAQKFLERRAVGGKRYQEQNFAFFGIKGSDGRLQRSEFLGGVKSPVVVSQVLQTSQTTSTSAQGTPSGNAVSAGGDFVCNRTFEEYGYIMGIMSVIPKADYMNGIPKMFLRRDPYDYYWPQFAKVGEQPIQNQELFMGLSASELDLNTATFGYTPRYAEYRFRNNRVSGDFKDTLSFWTLARSFKAAPTLSKDFIECKPSNRIFAVEDSSTQNHLWCEVHFNVHALRPVTKTGDTNI